MLKKEETLKIENTNKLVPITLKNNGCFTQYTHFITYKKTKKREDVEVFKDSELRQGLVQANVNVRDRKSTEREKTENGQKYEELRERKFILTKGKLVVSASLVLDVPKSKCRFGNGGKHPLLVNKPKNKREKKSVENHIFVAPTSKKG